MAYDFTVIYKQCKSNRVADPLSRQLEAAEHRSDNTYPFYSCATLSFLNPLSFVFPTWIDTVEEEHASQQNVQQVIQACLQHK